MTEHNYLIRKDNTQKVYLSRKTLDIANILEGEYSYIYDSMREENFLLKSYDCSLFKELLWDKKVVGFVTYDFSREFITYALNNIYILPEFRGKGIFLEELERTMSENSKPSIIEPTHLIVEMLIKYGFAEKISDNIVASAIEFIIPPNQVISNKGKDLVEEVSTHFYDMNISSSIHIMDYDDCHIVYNTPLNYDIIHYNCLEHRYGIDDRYFEGINDFFIEKGDEIKNIVSDLEEKLPLKSYSLGEIVGEDEGLSDYMESMVDVAHLSHVKALKIKDQITQEYNEGLVSNKALLIRLNYLSQSKHAPYTESHSETCPYCKMPIDSHDKFCHYCGINLDFMV